MWSGPGPIDPPLMCLIVFSYRCHPGFRLLLAANRDEFLERPTAPLGLHFDGELILGGRDLRGGGTWLALAADGRFGAITNYRDPARRMTGAPSRGALIVEYLLGSLSARDFLQRELAPRAHGYEGFNLLVGDRQELVYFSNISGEVRTLVPGLYGLSNHLLDTPWPKVQRIKRRFTAFLAGADEIRVPELFILLADRACPADQELPNTGVGLDWERRLAPVCITAPGYGTRSSSLLAIQEDGRAEFSERCYRHLPEFGVASEQRFFLEQGSFRRQTPLDNTSGLSDTLVDQGV